jgi:antitoxin component YwqK of YwqJK toxin-antitoxin module
VNGEQDGYWEFYHDNGQLEQKGYYVNGLHDGFWEYYDENGQLYSKGNYVNDNYYEDIQ